MLATMMVPAQVTMIPYFVIIRSLGWYNTLYPLWIGSFFAAAFSVFLLRQFLRGVPRDLEDAARIDGCGFWRIYWHIMLPLVRPTLAVIGIFTFMAAWSDFMNPLIYLSDERLLPPLPRPLTPSASPPTAHRVAPAISASSWPAPSS